MARKPKPLTASDFRSRDSMLQPSFTRGVRRRVRRRLPTILESLGFEFLGDHDLTADNDLELIDELDDIKEELVSIFQRAWLQLRDFDRATRESSVGKVLQKLSRVRDDEIVEAVCGLDHAPRSLIFRHWPRALPSDAFDTDPPQDPSEYRAAISAAIDTAPPSDLGRPPATAQRVLAAGLLDLYEWKSGRHAGRYNDWDSGVPKGPLFDFVVAVMSVVPENMIPMIFPRTKGNLRLVDYIVRLGLKERKNPKTIIPLPGSIAEETETIVIALPEEDTPTYDEKPRLCVLGVTPRIRRSIDSATPENPVRLLLANKYILRLEEPGTITVSDDAESESKLRLLVAQLKKAGGMSMQLPCRVLSGSNTDT